MSLQVRAYQHGDLSAVLQLINAAAQADRTAPTSEWALQSRLLGLASAPNLPQALVANLNPLSQPAIVQGFLWWELVAMGHVRLEGWVHPEWRRRGLGTALLAALQATLRPLPGAISLAGQAYADIPGVEPLFRRSGYKLVRRFHLMGATLGTDSWHGPETPLPPGLVVRSLERGDMEPLAEADNDIFTEHWGASAQRPHDSSLWILIFARDDESRIVAECLCHASQPGGSANAWISTVGVRREWRGRGLGRAVLAQGLRRLQAAGYETAALHVDEGNAAAINLYRGLGFDVLRTRLHFARLVSAEQA